MSADRRAFLGVMAVGLSFPAAAEGASEMYGMIGKMSAAPAQRDALIAILSESTTKMPGCLSYVIAKDAADQDTIWVTEVWDSKASHDASLSLPAVKEAIRNARPLIAGGAKVAETQPVGGVGLLSQPQ